MPIDAKSTNEVFNLPNEELQGDKIITAPLKENLTVESKCSYEFHSTRCMLMGFDNSPKTKKERVEEERRANLRREVKKGKRSATALLQKKKKKLVP